MPQGSSSLNQDTLECDVNFLKSLLKYSRWRAPGWLSGLNIQLLVLAQIIISCGGIQPHIGLCADIPEPAWDPLSTPLCPSPTGARARSLSLSLCLQINKQTLKKCTWKVGHPPKVSDSRGLSGTKNAHYSQVPKPHCSTEIISLEILNSDRTDKS